MKQPFDVTLQYFVINDGCAMAAPGAVPLGKLSSLEVLQVLMIFQEMSPVQSFTGEPQIQILVKGEKYLVRTDLNRLMLYNSRKLHEPALVMEAQQIITEIDESALKERDALLRRLNKAGGVATLTATSGEEEDMPALQGVWTTSIPWLGALAVALILACVHFVRLELAPSAQVEVKCSPIVSVEEILYRREALAGLYLSGNNPGQHVIILLSSGGLRLMQVNGTGGPSELKDTYQILSGDEGMFLQTTQPGPLIQVVSKETLSYGGETYRRKY